MPMRFKTLQMTNFGPYAGTQSLTFGERHPVVIVHGPNMAGKTSLLNAVRWVLYGHAYTRSGGTMPFTKIVNKDASDAGNWVVSVKLVFEVDGTEYELERSAQARSASTPHSDNDFVEKLFLKENGRYLDGGEVQSTINRILPEQISRFFLFDGELLDEYEALLSTDKQASTIKLSIEHILGVPALVNAVDDLKQNLRDAARRQQNLAKQDHQASVFANEADRIEAEITAQERDLGELRSQREEFLDEQRELDSQLRDVAGLEEDVVRRQGLIQQISLLRDQQNGLQEQNKLLLADAWRDFFQPSVRVRLEHAEQERAQQMGRLQRSAAIEASLRNIEQMLRDNHCPVCGQQTINADLTRLSHQRGKLESDLADLNFDQAALDRANDTIRRLRQIAPANVMPTIHRNEEHLLRLRVALANVERQIEQIDERLKGHDHASIARNRRQHTEVTKKLGVIETTIEAKVHSIGDLQASATRIRAQISKVAGPEMHRLNREVEIHEQLIAVFEHAVAHLRDDLRKAVERDASDIFRQLTTDKTYQGLRINNFYGLTILNAKGQEVTVRSAGAEQVVALSLIGALNRNAVRKGPIIMDTPFGRLDPTHRENILRFVPTMAEQVTLLVHGGEIDAERDLERIRTEIDREYTITHATSSRSSIEPLHVIAPANVRASSRER